MIARFFDAFPILRLLFCGVGDNNDTKTVYWQVDLVDGYYVWTIKKDGEK